MASVSRTYAGDAFREEFNWRGRMPVLLAGAVAFGLSAPLLWADPTWILALALSVGYSTGYGLAATLGLVLDPRRWSAVFGLLLPSVLGGMSAGWMIEEIMSPGEMNQVNQHARAGLHLAFCATLMIAPLAQAARRWRALRKVEAERARVQAELQMLQAQIEPHFLFNTLATLRSLVRQQSTDALPLLDRMTAFLEAVLPQVRERQSTLGREFLIVEQYLAIMAIRMAPRLRYRIDIPPELHGFPIPPLLIQPLVENAVLHGIEPCETGGDIAVSAAMIEGTLNLTVSNTGVPLGSGVATAGRGLALRNLSERLGALFGEQGRFTLRAGEQCTQAILTLPNP